MTDAPPALGGRSARQPRAVWQARAAQPVRVALPDAHDMRVLTAAMALWRDGLAEPVLFADPAAVRVSAREAGLGWPLPLELVDPGEGAEERIAVLYATEGGWEPEADQAQALAADPLHAAALALQPGAVDACVAGSVRRTAEVVRAAIPLVGLAEGVRVLSSSFLLGLSEDRLVAYGDCGVVPQPDAEELADIAVATARTYEVLTGDQARVAMLSFSTKGSARHPAVDRILEATRLVGERWPELVIHVELQFDAACLPEVAAVKTPDSPLVQANVFVFPNLDAGNIRLQDHRALADAMAFGPLLQGLARPMNDVSQACETDDIATVALLTSPQAQQVGAVPAVPAGNSGRPVTGTSATGSP